VEQLNDDQHQRRDAQTDPPEHVLERLRKHSALLVEHLYVVAGKSAGRSLGG
jgi:hypothetical protein